MRIQEAQTAWLLQKRELSLARVEIATLKRRVFAMKQHADELNQAEETLEEDAELMLSVGI